MKSLIKATYDQWAESYFFLIRSNIYEKYWLKKEN